MKKAFSRESNIRDGILKLIVAFPKSLFLIFCFSFTYQSLAEFPLSISPDEPVVGQQISGLLSAPCVRSFPNPDGLISDVRINDQTIQVDLVTRLPAPPFCGIPAQIFLEPFQLPLLVEGSYELEIYFVQDTVIFPAKEADRTGPVGTLNFNVSSQPFQIFSLNLFSIALLILAFCLVSGFYFMNRV